jgi:hypothetical protein
MTLRRGTFEPRWLFQYGAGQFTPVVVSEGAAPGGKWPKNVVVRRPLTMNERGNVGFAASVLLDKDNGKMSWGTFLWDAGARQVQAVALKGMRATSSKVFVQGASANGTGAYINNRDEIAFTADVSFAYGVDAGLFLRGRDGQLTPVILPGQTLSTTARLQAAGFPKLNDAGMIAFWAVQYAPSNPYKHQVGVYLWEGGKLSLIAMDGGDAPGGGKFSFQLPVVLNNRDRSVLVEAETTNPRRSMVYRYLDGQLTPLLERGMELPGAGKLKELGPVRGPDDAGRYTFSAILEDNSTGLYRLEMDGTATLHLKSGTKTEWGMITRIGQGLRGQSQGMEINSKGQIATVASFDDGPDTVVLLTPPSP